MSFLNPISRLYSSLVFLVWFISPGTLHVASDQAVATVSSTARIDPAPTSYQFPNRKSYTYSGEWHFLNAGTAVLRTEASSKGQEVIATANSTGTVGALFPVHDRFHTWVNPHTFCATSISKHTEEGSRKRDTEVRFDYVRHKNVLNEKNLKNGEQKHAEHDIPSCVVDVWSGFYYLGSRPLVPGATCTFPVNDGGETSEVTAHAETWEDIKTPAGNFHTLRIKADATAGPLKNKGQLTVWISEDSQRMPVQMKARVKWGTVTFKLVKITAD